MAALIYFKSRRSRQYSEKGQSLLELTICLPFLLILGSGLADLTLLIMSGELITDAVRYGGTYAYLNSKQNLSCEELKAKTIEQTTAYIDIVLTPAQKRYWDQPQVKINNINWDGISFPYVEVEFRTLSNSTCIICFEKILANLDYSISTSFLPQSSCT